METVRLPSRPRDQLDEGSRQLWDRLCAGRGSELLDEDGGLAGPVNAWIQIPEIGSLLCSLGTVLRTEATLDEKLRELAIITVATRWHAEFQWWAHVRLAKERGITDAIVEAIHNGEHPPFSDDGEAIVYDVARQLTTTGKLEDQTWHAASRLLGDKGIIELVALCGYYCVVSFTLNAFEVRLPPSVEPAWTG